MSTLREASTIETTEPASTPRTYEVRTFGCQMNVHDSERLSGSLEAAGYVPADGAEPDIVVINTCAVRENADNKLYGNLGHLAGVKRRHAGMQIAVGGHVTGCLQRSAEALGVVHVHLTAERPDLVGPRRRRRLGGLDRRGLVKGAHDRTSLRAIGGAPPSGGRVP